MIVAAMWVNQLIHAHYEYLEHQQLHSQDKQILQMLESQLANSEDQIQFLQEIVDSLEAFPVIQKSVQDK
jgi:uncharacterized protein YecA (UPF0149 family)